ncbi:MAG: response regulator [Lachnospiraceae bacterium]|nr:response regulator [Lachnospiraceae bacterium]
MRIIAVDDERIALEGLISAIKKVVPEEIRGFRSSEEALQYVKNNPVDVAFLDIEMREMNGVTLAKHLKAICHSINIIFTTGYGEYRECAFALHASGYVTKPVTPEKISLK